MSRFSVSEVVCGENNQPKVVLVDSAVDQLVEIYLLGATVTSWKVKGVEKIFLSDLAVFNGKKAIRGGIPLVFPQFGQPNTVMPQHGFARTTEWTLLRCNLTEDSGTVNLTMSQAPETLALWPHNFTLNYSVKLDDTGLTTALEILNTDEDLPFSCQALLHTYLRVSDIHTTSVTGFQNYEYVDKMAENGTFIDQRAAADFTKEVDRIYVGKQDEKFNISIKNSAISGDDALTVVSITCDSFIVNTSIGKPERKNVPTDCVLWNAWIDKTLSIADLQDTAYNHYVCVEPGVVKDWTTVKPLEKLTLTQTLHI